MNNQILISLMCDSDLKQKHKDQPFWANLSEEYPSLSKQSIIVLLPFTTIHLCEAGFSYYAATKTKCRNRLDATLDVRIQLSTIVPDIKKICTMKTIFNIKNIFMSGAVKWQFLL